MLVEELATKLGLDLDVLSFAKAIFLAEGLKDGLEGIAEVAKHVAKELVSFVTETAEHGSQLEEMSKRTGISTDRLQELQYAAQATGSDIGVLVMGIRHMSISAAEAAQGNAGLARAYRDLGVHTTNASGKLRDGDAIFQDVALSMSKLTNETQKARLGQQLFGRVAQYLNPLMRSGESSLGALTDRFRELQLSMSPEEIAHAHEFTLGMMDFNLVMNRLKYSIGGAVLPALTKLLRTSITWVQEMRKALHDNWDVYLERVKFAVMGIGATILAYVLPGLGAWIAELGVTISWYVALGIAALVTGEGALAASLLPILGWLALAAVIVLVAEDLYQFFTGGESAIGDFLEGPFARLQWEFQDIWNTVKFYAGVFWDWLTDAGSRAVHGIIDKFHELVQSVKDIFSGVTNGRWLLEHAFGTGAQGPLPQAALAGAGGTSSSFNADITVHPPPGSSSTDIADQTVGAFDEWHAGVLQDSLNDTDEE